MKFINKINLILLLLSLVSSAPAEDEVKSLEGYIDFSGKFKMYSGYLQIQENPLINVHYLFVTSQDNPEKDDVLMWYNGGPGCSSLIGFAQEVGPNMMMSGSNKFASYLNKYSWNNHANLLFFESPPGVGFSINKDTSYVYNQSRTASDNVKAIQKWFEKFPQFTQNNFWISGESYNGMYIPNLASQIIDANNNHQLTSEGKINFKGVLIGNGVMVTDKNWRRFAHNHFYSSHYYYGPETDKLLSYCKYTDEDARNAPCMQGQQKADEDINMLNPYATIGVCYTPKEYKLGRRRFWYTPFHEVNNPILTEENLEKHSGGPCTDDDGITDYFNKPSVKKALHIDETIDWQTCSSFIGQNYMKDPSSIPLFKKLKENKIKILLFSGNADAVVSYVQSEEYIRQIGWKQLSKRTPITNNKDSLMGWITEYEGMTYYVVNGAGHMVPEDKPHAAYQMMREFMNRDKTQIMID